MSHLNNQTAAEAAKKVLIIEQQGARMNRVDESDASTGRKSYVFEGPCAEFNAGLNQNNRYYKKDEYLSHFSYLIPEIEACSMMGELDHHEDYMPSMKRLSHIVRKLWYDEALNQVWIRIELLDTADGKDAKAVADAGAPIFISSRASGYIADDGLTTLEHIYTYDIVYRPGFKIAKLKRLNVAAVTESLDLLQIYEWNESFGAPAAAIDKARTSHNPSPSATPGMSDFLNKTEFQNFIGEQNKRLDEKFDAMTRLIQGGAKPTSESAEAVAGAVPTLEGQVAEIASEMKAVKEFLALVVEQVNGQGAYANVQSNFANELANFADRISARVNEVSAYATAIATRSNEQGEYVAAIAQRSNEHTLFMDAIANRTNEQAEFLNVVVNRVNEQAEFGDLIANRVNEQAEYAGLIAERSNDQGTFLNLLAHRANEHSAFMNVIGARVNESTEYATQIALTVNDLTTGKAPIVVGRTGRTANESAIAGPLFTASGAKSVTETVDQVLQNAKQKKASRQSIVLETQYPFITRMDDASRATFESLSEVKQKRIGGSITELGNRTNVAVSAETMAQTIKSVMESSPSIDLMLEAMPKKLVKTWEAMGPRTQESVISLFQMRGIRDTFHAELFWETLNLDPTGQAAQVSESLSSTEIASLVPRVSEGVSELGYSLDDVASSLR